MKPQKRTHQRHGGKSCKERKERVAEELTSPGLASIGVWGVCEPLNDPPTPLLGRSNGLGDPFVLPPPSIDTSVTESRCARDELGLDFISFHIPIGSTGFYTLAERRHNSNAMKAL